MYIQEYEATHSVNIQGIFVAGGFQLSELLHGRPTKLCFL